MTAYMSQRLIESLPVFFLATMVIFLGLRLLPGDPALILAGQDATPETLQAIRQANGLDQPLPAQYVIWLNNAVHGDLGVSFFTRSPVSQHRHADDPFTTRLGISNLCLRVCASDGHYARKSD